MVIFDSDQLQAIFYEGDSDYLLITFNAIGSLANNSAFFGEPVARAANISTLGFMSKSRNWFPRSYMKMALEAVGFVLKRFPDRLAYGYSMGAYGAIKYAHLLGVSTVVAICPQYSIDPSDTADYDPHYNYLYSTELNGDMGIAESDRSGVCYLLYDNKYEPDVQHVRRISAAVAPRLVPVPYTRHETMHCFTSTRAITKLFRLARDRDDKGVRSLAIERRKIAPIRIYGLGVLLMQRHRVWAEAVLDAKGRQLDNVLAHDYAQRLGEIALRHAEPERAIRLFHIALARNPDSAKTLFALSEAYLQSHELDLAIQFARRAAASETDDPTVPERFVQMLLRAGEIAEARREARNLASAQSGRRAGARLMSEIEERAGNLKLSAEWARVAAETEPRDLASREHLVRRLIAADDIPAARKEALGILDLQPDHLAALRLMSDIADRQKQFNEAIGWARKVVAVEPGDAHVRERLAHLQAAAGDLEGARSDALALLALVPGHVSAMWLLCDVANRAKRFDEAIDWACKVIRAEPGNAYFRERLAHLRVAAGDLAGARSDARELLALAPGHISAMWILCDVANQEKRFEEAIDWAGKVTQAEPGNAYFRERLAHLRAAAGDLEAARADAHALLALAPGHVSAMWLLSDLANREKRFHEAVEWADKVVRAEPGNAYFRERLAHLRVAAGDLEGARSDALALLALVPGHVSAMWLLSDLANREQRFEEAVAWARKVARAEPKNAHVRERLVHLLIVLKDFDAARAEAMDQLETLPDTLGALKLMCDIESSDKRYGAAMEWARKCVAAAPGQPDWHHRLVQLLLVTGDLAAARQEIDLILKANPNDARAAQVIADIETRNLDIARWKERHFQLVEGLGHFKPNVLLIGDSITDQWLHAGRKLWDRFFAPLHAATIAISGETTTGVLWRLENGALRDLSPEMVILMIGTNDIPFSHPQDIAQRTGAIVRDILGRLPFAKLLLLGVLPRGADSSSHLRQEVIALNRLLARLEQRPRLTFLDLSDCLLDGDGHLSPSIAPDALHLSEEGYARLAPPLRHAIDQALG